jgi:hypothetical protein
MLLRSALAVMCALCASAQSTDTKEGDPGGWTKTKWGMTLAEVKKTLEGRAREVKPGDEPFLGRTKLVIDEQKIGSTNYSVEFMFGAFWKLSKIVIRPKVHGGTPLRPLRDELARLLSEKYGRPASDSSSNMVPPLETVWLFPKTQITLSLFRYGDSGDLTLVYTEREKSPDAL